LRGEGTSPGASEALLRVLIEQRGLNSFRCPRRAINRNMEILNRLSRIKETQHGRQYWPTRKTLSGWASCTQSQFPHTTRSRVGSSSLNNDVTWSRLTGPPRGGATLPMTGRRYSRRSSPSFIMANTDRVSLCRLSIAQTLPSPRALYIMEQV
jgi:hypothetical protein